MLVQVNAGTVHVMRETAWRALVEGKDYSALPGATVVVLPDNASTAEVLATVRAVQKLQVPATPLGTPPPG